LLLLGCAILVAVAKPAGAVLGVRFANVLFRVSKGKIANAEAFISNRLIEAAWLIAAAILLLLVYHSFRRLTEKRVGVARYSWAILALAAFVLVNVWLFGAMRTCLFWGLCYTGKNTSNVTQFHFKELLLTENTAPRQVILVGSSQTRAQLDENLLNDRIGKQVWTTELHFPGSKAIDLLLVLRRLKGQPGDDLVCYLSECYFYNGLYSESAPYFISFHDLPLLSHLGLSSCLATGQFAYGLVGDLFPMVRCREPLTDRFLGRRMGSLAQTSYDSALEANLIKRAEKASLDFKLGKESQVQKAAFEAFIAEAGRQKRHVILLEGQLNPLLGERIDPAVRQDMKRYLRGVIKDHDNVTLIAEDELPAQTPNDYDDLTHVNESTQTRFTGWFANQLTSKLRSKIALNN